MDEIETLDQCRSRQRLLLKKLLLIEQGWEPAHLRKVPSTDPCLADLIEIDLRRRADEEVSASELDLIAEVDRHARRWAIAELRMCFPDTEKYPDAGSVDALIHALLKEGWAQPEPSDLAYKESPRRRRVATFLVWADDLAGDRPHSRDTGVTHDTE